MAIEVLRVSANLLRVSRRIRPTHIFVPDFEAVLRNAPALFWQRLRGARVIMRLGNAPSPGRFYEWMWRHLIDPLVDRFVVNSDFTRRELLAVGVSGDKVEMIANMPARRPVGSTSDGPRIAGRVIFVGQIIPEKGLDLLLDAVAILRASGIDATLDVVGSVDGWESPTYAGHRSMIRERAARPDLAGAVNFVGWREDVPALMAQSALHCCPSRPEQRESFGNVVLEAKAAGLPSVVTASGGLPELIAHRDDGWVCTEATPEALAEGIGYFLSSPDERGRAGAAALASVARYSEQRFVCAWNQVFRIVKKDEIDARA
jgi:glycosyltransferase involved in cell wall biosynthesis